MKERNSWIDALKGIAICAVIARHSGGASLQYPLGQILGIGANGVQLFMLISAMMCWGSLDRSKEGNVSYIRWLGRRLVRLAPLYYLAIVVYIVLLGGNQNWLGSEGHVTIANVLTHLLFINGVFPHYMNSILGVEWYLGVLAIFYILAPLLHKFIDSMEKAMGLTVVSTILSAVLIPRLCGMVQGMNDSELICQNIGGFGILAQFPILCIGIVLYYILQHTSPIENKRLFSYLMFIITLILLWALAIEKCSINLISREVIFGVTFAILIVGIKEHPLHIVDNKLWSGIGRLSYPMYLFHYVVVRVYERYLPLSAENTVLSWWIEFVIVVAISYVLSVLLDRFFDEPIRKMIHI